MPDIKPSLDRRSALKRAAAAGAIAWSVPTVVSQTARAADGVCTPQCLAQSSGTVTATASLTCGGAGVNRNVTLQVTLTGQPTVTCPCGGTAQVSTNVTANNVPVTLSGNVITVPLGRGSGGVTAVRVTYSATCIDGSGDTCVASTCRGILVQVFLNDQGNCNGAGAAVTAVGDC